MTDPRAVAERLVRRFARHTNLMIAGRAFAVVPGDASGSEDAEAARSADALATLLRNLGARVVPVGTPGAVHLDANRDSITRGGSPLPDRGDASGRLDFAREHMPVTAALAAELAESGLARDLRIGIALMLEPKTANLALFLRDAGADVAVYAHPDETDPYVADALRDRGIAVDADAGLAGDAERAAALGFVRRGFDVFMDDGSHIVRLAHEELPDEVAGWIGTTEETTSGLAPLRTMAAQGALRTPVVAVNDAATKTMFDNRYGTGQSCVFAIADLLEAAGVTVRDQPALVIGYGPVGEGVAAHLRALGADVAVAELDPLRALVAAHDGYRVGRAAELAPGALVVSATGVRGTIPASMIRNAAAVAVAGGVPGEIDLDEALAEPGEALHPVAPHLERLASTGTLVLDRGGCINVTAAEGNPIEIMDLSFATQIAGLTHLLAERPGTGVHAIPADAVAHVAATATTVRGLAVDAKPGPGIGLGTDEGTDEGIGDDADWRSWRYRKDSTA